MCEVSHQIPLLHLVHLLKVLYSLLVGMQHTAKVCDCNNQEKTPNQWVQALLSTPVVTHPSLMFTQEQLLLLPHSIRV